MASIDEGEDQGSDFIDFIDNNQEDSDYEGICKPPILRQLRNILDQYPDGSQIIRELVQNAEDAGARSFVIFYKEGNNIPAPQASKFSYRGYFRTPALCVHNDGIFTADDWKGIKSIYTSVKEKDALKVGRFGLGFKSIFHITDSPIIISGDQLLIINPMELPHRVCHKIPFRKLKTPKYKEAWSLMRRTLGLEGEGLFGLNEAAIDNQQYPKTLFWFPLRQKESELSNKIYTSEKMTELFESFEEEAETILLFLKSVNLVSIYDTQFRKKFEVNLKGIGNEDITEKREYIKNQVKGNELPAESLWSEYKAVLTTWKLTSQQETTIVQEWLVINHFRGENDMVDSTMLELAQDVQLGYAPYVGVAFPLTREMDRVFNGHVFCFLPLPIEPDGRSLTNLPVHVNGFFALTSNRRHMLWASHDQHESDDNRLKWNHLLISEVLSAAYIRLVKLLLEDSRILPEIIYSSLPNSETIDLKWSILLQPIYTEVLHMKIFYTESGDNQNGRMLSFEDALFFCFDREREKVSKEVEETLWKVLSVYTDDLVRLPHHLQFIINSKDFLRIKPRTINAKLVCSFLLKDPRYRSFQKSQKLHILQYLLDNTRVDQYENIQLLPTNDPTTCVSIKNDMKTVCICLNGEEKMFPLLDRQLISSVPENKIVIDQLKRKVFSSGATGNFGIKEFSSSDFVLLLECSIEKQKISDGIPQSKKPEILTWISEIWQYLSKNEDLIENVQHLNILAETEGEKNVNVVQLHVLDGLYVLKRQGSSSISGAVCDILQSFGVTLLNALPGFMPNAFVEKYVCSPSTSGVCDVLVKLLSQTTNERYLAQKIEELSATKRKQFAVFMSQANYFDGIVKNFLKNLKIFPVIPIKNHNTLCSLTEVDKITPPNYKEYPISLPNTMIDGEFKGIQLAFMLGCSRWSDEQLTLSILSRIKDNKICEREKIDAFMDFFLNRIQFATPEQIQMSTVIPFIESDDGERRNPQELFEITENLQKLFYGEKDRFPKNHKLVNKHINGLRKLGLKSSINISINDLIKTLNVITENNTNQSKETKLKLKAFEKFVNQLVRPTDSTLQNVQEILGKMRSSSWMSPKNIKPKHYPQKIQWFCGENKLQTPGEMYHSEYEMLVGSVALVAESSLNSELLDCLLHQKPSSDLVLEQLLLLSESYNDSTDRSEFLQMLTTIYDYLANDRLPQSTVDVYREKNIVWTGKVFAKPKDVFIEFINDSTEMTFEPFMYQIHPEKETHKILFSQLGCLDRIEVENILNILHDIKECQKSLSWEKSKHNLLVVEGILNVLEELNDKDLLSGDEIDRILFPVKTSDNLFELLPAKECTYVDYKREIDELEDDEEDLKIVHTKIRSSMAENLGVPSLTRRIVEIKGVEDIPWGQKEELTDRLKNLIEEYADGISVLKEMLQNADDAGATCLRILYDERTNENAKIGLIDKGMAECQGPAIWVYNDAKFEEKDFQNIIKLGAGTKMADLTKIGKFGLGFCSVYNITDVPSILSGDSLVILDPRMINLGKALKDNNPGLRFRISDSKTRHRLRHQLRPYNGIFGCDFQCERTVMSYEGTLFRFPLRTAKQADETKSQISPKQYTKDDVAKLIFKFIEDAGNLMLFIQNVNKIEFFHLPTQASESHLFYSITRCFENDKSNILVKANPNLDIQRKQPIQTVENICISIKIHEDVEQLHQLFKQETIKKKSSNTKWVIVWQIGTNAQSLPYTHTKNNVIVGGIAIPVMHSLMECTEAKQSVMPFGFYPRGHVFCFLPLPQESYIPVHVNGYFAVESSRRRLVAKSSDNLISEGADWNIFLLQNVICDSYLCLLEKLADLFQKENCYKNWPHQGKDNMINELVVSFYENLVTSKRKLVYMDQDSSDIKRYSFKECVFLNPDLRYESEGKICEKALECFLRFNSYEPQKHAMDLPRDTYEQLKRIPTCHSKLKETICDKKTFYLDSFFPSLSTEFWNQSTEERNKLILLAFELENEEVKHLIRETQCIPTQPYGKLRKPSELIYPDPFNNSFCISRLFSKSDERFPSEEFNKSSIVKELKIMGMMTDTLTNELVVDRVKSLKRLAKQPAKITERCNYMLQYLELKLETHKQVQEALQNIKFLPVLQKPSSWLFKWAATESKKFESGKKLCLKNCKNVAGCVSPIVNLDGRFERVLKYLGVQGTTDIDETVVLNQFQEITRIVPNEKINEIWEIYRDVYAYLNETDCSLLSTFEDQCCLLTKSGLVKPNASALELRCDLEPFLFRVDDRWKYYENFLRCIGVKRLSQSIVYLRHLRPLTQKREKHRNMFSRSLKF